MLPSGAVLALVAVVALTASAPTEPAAQLLGVSPRGELLTLASSGDTVRTLIPGGSMVPVDATWSPDGSRIAFSSPTTNGRGNREIFVIDADGTDLHAITSGSDVDHYETQPLWVSPTEVVYHHRDEAARRTDLRIVDTESGVWRELVADVDWNFPLLLQPGGRLLVYTVASELHRAIVNVDTGARQALPDDVREAVAWSHDGTRLAYATPQGLFVVSPDGSGRRTVVSDRHLGSSGVAWSPDDAAIAFTILTEFAQTRFGTPTLAQVYTVSVDGSRVQQLTGMPGDTPELQAGGSMPQWWPSGSRLFFQRQGGTWMMNADGSCEQRWPSVALFAPPRWRPTATVPATALACSSVITRLHALLFEVALGKPAPLQLLIRNDGTTTLEDIRVTLAASGGTVSGPAGCTSAVCVLGSLPPGQERVVAFTGSSPRPGLLRLRTTVSYRGGGDVSPSDDSADVAVSVAPCDLLGSWGPDRLIGTPHGDRICGRPGDDRIEGRGGDDVIDAGSGADTVIGGAGHDRIDAGGGNDVILARDNTRDRIDCGSERDTVIADRSDVLSSCERVFRR